MGKCGEGKGVPLVDSANGLTYSYSCYNIKGTPLSLGMVRASRGEGAITIEEKKRGGNGANKFRFPYNDPVGYWLKEE